MLHCYTQSKHIDLAELRRWDDLAYDWRQQLVESPLGWGSGAGLWTLGLTLTDHGSSGRLYQHLRGQKTTAGDFWSKFGWGKKWRKASNLGGIFMDFWPFSTHFRPPPLESQSDQSRYSADWVCAAAGPALCWRSEPGSEGTMKHWQV